VETSYLRASRATAGCSSGNLWQVRCDVNNEKLQGCLTMLNLVRM
jgi:hypothetical protein